MREAYSRARARTRDARECGCDLIRVLSVRIDLSPYGNAHLDCAVRVLVILLAAVRSGRVKFKFN